MTKNIKIGSKLIITVCILLLVIIGVTIYKANQELDFNTINSNDNIKTGTNTLVNNVVVDSNIIE